MSGDTCPTCGSNKRDFRNQVDECEMASKMCCIPGGCGADCYPRCKDAWHNEPATQPAAPTVAARREAVVESLGNATAFCSRYAQERAAEVTAELNRLWAIEDAASLACIGYELPELAAALKGAEHEHR